MYRKGLRKTDRLVLRRSLQEDVSHKTTSVITHFSTTIISQPFNNFWYNSKYVFTCVLTCI